jgi:hypothetical protein
MPSVKLIVTISVIIGVIVVVGVGFSISSRPAGNNEKPNTNQEFKQLSGKVVKVVMSFLIRPSRGFLSAMIKCL